MYFIFDTPDSNMISMSKESFVKKKKKQSFAFTDLRIHLSADFINLYSVYSTVKCLHRVYFKNKTLSKINSKKRRQQLKILDGDIFLK